MNQTLQIFAKDARRFWPEIAISIALLAAFAYVQPLAASGQAHHDAGFVLYSILLPILYVLVYISWWILVSRVVHEENLVGDRQFWITRPYQWPSLLAAKLLFLAVFVLLPVALMQIVLLSESGFHPTHLLPGIVFSAALLGVTVVLPLAALSTVTSTFARLTVTMLGIFITTLIVGALFIPHTRNFGVTPHADWPYLLLTFAAFSGIVLLQYARRRTLIARVILGATMVLLVLLPVFFSTSLMALYFPASSAPASGSFDIKTSATQQPWISGTTTDSSGEIQTVSIPIDFSGVSPNSIVAIEAVRVTATTASGLKYSGPWRSQGESPHHLEKNGVVPVVLPKSFFDQAGVSPVSISLSLGITQLTSQGTSSAPFPTGKTEFPGIGICSGDEYHTNDGNSYFLSCTSALRDPEYTYVTGRWSDVSCKKPQPPANQLIPGDTYIGSFDSEPAAMGLSPLISQQINLSNGMVTLPNNASRQRYLCARTPLTFTRYVLTRRFGTKLFVPNLNLQSLPLTPFGNPAVQLTNPAADPDE